MSNYDIDYFIAKFEAIPEENWCRAHYTDYAGRHCAIGHCGGRIGHETEESKALSSIFGARVLVTYVNDNSGAHPKEAILNALRDIKNDGHFEREE